MKNKEKLVPKLRFPEFEDQWRYKKLEEVTDCLDTKRKPLNSEERLKKQGTIPYYGANGIVDYINDYIFNERLILLAEDGGNFFEFENKPIAQKIFGKSWVNNHAHVLRPRDINFDYLFYNLVHKDIRKYINGGTRLKLNQSDMLRIKISIPSLPEQEKIGKFFSTIDKKLDLQRERIKELKSYKKGMMQRIFDQEIRFKDENGRDYPDWKEKKLGDVGEFYRGKGLAKKDIDLEAKNKCILYGELFTRYDEVINEIKSYTKVIPKNKVVSKKFDLLFPTSTTASPVSLIKPSVILEKNVIVGGDISVFRPKREIVNTIYLSYIINNCLKYDIARYVEGITIYHIYSNQLKNIKVQLPSLPEQEKIANFLSAIDRWIELEEEKLELYEDFKKGLMQRMFV